MPTFTGKDGKPQFRMNPQVGKSMFGEKNVGSPKDKGDAPTDKLDDSGASDISIHGHGDGSYHTESGDEARVEHPDLSHALAHIAHHEEPGGKHFHIHSEGGVHRSHGIDENGEHEGPHDHQNLEELKDHMDQFLSEEEREGDPKYDTNEANDNGRSDIANLMF